MISIVRTRAIKGNITMVVQGKIQSNHDYKRRQEQLFCNQANPIKWDMRGQTAKARRHLLDKGQSVLAMIARAGPRNSSPRKPGEIGEFSPKHFESNIGVILGIPGKNSSL